VLALFALSGFVVGGIIGAWAGVVRIWPVREKAWTAILTQGRWAGTNRRSETRRLERVAYAGAERRALLRLTAA
jgi:hypothetical protein